MSDNTDLSITVLISGSGTNLQALIDAQGKLNARVTHVISNRKNAYGLERAKKASIPTTYHNLAAYKKKHPETDEGVQQAREEYDRDLVDIVTKQESKPDLVVCAGWMHILGAGFVDALKEADVPIINLHPALPGQFNGADAIQRAYGAFQRGEIAVTGVMVHYVVDEVDMGEPILVKEVECKLNEQESDLEARIHEVEWVLIVDATAKVLTDIVQDRRAKSQ